LSSGLNERYASSGAFGDGTYLAEDAGKADQYCRIDAGRSETRDALHDALYPGGSVHPGKVCYVMLVSVLMGEAVVSLDGCSSDGGGEVWANSEVRRELATVPGSSPPFSYHSLLVETGKSILRYREIVQCHADRILIKYLIAYRRGQHRMYEVVEQATEGDQGRIMEVFRKFDADGNGTISKEELMAFMSEICSDWSEEDIDTLVSQCDKNGDGVIDFEEFLAFLGF